MSENTYLKERNEKLAQKVVNALKKRHLTYSSLFYFQLLGNLLSLALV